MSEATILNQVMVELVGGNTNELNQQDRKVLVETIRESHKTLLDMFDWPFARRFHRPEPRRDANGRFEKSPYGQYWLVYDLPTGYIGGLRVFWDYAGSYNNNVDTASFRPVGKQLHVKTPYGFGSEFSSVVTFRYTVFVNYEDCPASYHRALALEAAYRASATFNYNNVDDLRVRAANALRVAQTTVQNDEDKDSQVLFKPPNPYGRNYTLQDAVNLDPNNPNIGFQIY